MSTLKIEEKFTVAAPVERVWQFLLSPELVAGCLPGAALRGQEGADTYLGTMKIKVGPVTSEFKGKATMSDIDPAAHRLKLTGTGDDVSGGGSARMSMDLGVREAAEGSEVQVVADVEIAGKLVRFGRGMIEGVSKQLFKQFVERARDRITRASEAEAAAPSPGPKSPDAATEDVPVTTPAEAVGSPPDAAPAPGAPSEAISPEVQSAPASPPVDAAASAPAAVGSSAPPSTAGGTPNEAAAAVTDAAAAPASAQPQADTKAASEAETAVASSPGPAAMPAGSAAAPGASGRGPAPAPEASDITTGVLPRPKPRPMAITVPKEEPEALDAGSLVFRALWEWVKSLFRRLLGRGS